MPMSQTKRVLSWTLIVALLMGMLHIATPVQAAVTAEEVQTVSEISELLNSLESADSLAEKTKWLSDANTFFDNHDDFKYQSDAKTVCETGIDSSDENIINSCVNHVQAYLEFYNLLLDINYETHWFNGSVDTTVATANYNASHGTNLIYSDRYSDMDFNIYLNDLGAVNCSDYTKQVVVSHDFSNVSELLDDSTSTEAERMLWALKVIEYVDTLDAISSSHYSYSYIYDSDNGILKLCDNILNVSISDDSSFDTTDDEIYVNQIKAYLNYFYESKQGYDFANCDALLDALSTDDDLEIRKWGVKVSAFINETNSNTYEYQDEMATLVKYIYDYVVTDSDIDAISYVYQLQGYLKYNHDKTDDISSLLSTLMSASPSDIVDDYVFALNVKHICDFYDTSDISPELNEIIENLSVYANACLSATLTDSADSYVSSMQESLADLDNYIEYAQKANEKYAIAFIVQNDAEGNSGVLIKDSSDSNSEYDKSASFTIDGNAEFPTVDFADNELYHFTKWYTDEARTTLFDLDDWNNNRASITLYEGYEVHNYNKGATVNPTCFKTGSQAYYCDCGHSYTEVIPADSTLHNYTIAGDVVDATCEEDGYKEFKCSNEGCSSATVEVITHTGHKWNDGEVTVTPSCKPGLRTYTCEICGITKTEEISATGEHTWNDGEVTREATCSAYGQTTYTCTICGTTETRDNIPKLEHNYSSDFTVDVEPNCNQEGSKSKHCMSCDSKTEVTVIPKLTTHSWNSGTVTKEATCEDNGILTKECTVCHTTTTEDIQSLGHDYSTEFTVDTEPTCSQEGSKSKHCSRCDSKTEVTAISKVNHTWDDGIVTTQSTCKDFGIKTFTCAVCKTTKTEQIAKLTEHTWNNGVVTTQPTETSEGIKTYTCTVCGTTKTESVAKLTHQHAWDSGTVTAEPTCAKKGVRTYHCSGCNETKTEEVPVDASAHTWNAGEVTKQATCKEAGVKTYTCSECHDTRTESIAKLTTHTWDNGSITKQPTTTSTGIKTYTCAVCEITKTEEVAKLPSESESPEPDTPIEEHTCVYVSRVASQPTCSEYGTKLYTCLICGEQKTANIAKLQHIWDDGTVVTEPTCKASGVITCKCLNCDTVKNVQIPKLAVHSETEIVNVKGATCTENGYAGDIKCTLCNEILTTGTVIKALGHTYTDVVTVQATTESAGIRTFTCSNCGDTYTESISKLKVICKHASTEIRNKFDATCKSEGYTGDTYCKTCGELISNGKSIVKLSTHQWNSGKVTKKATESSTGIMTYTCNICRTTKTKTIAKLTSGKYSITYVLNGGTKNNSLNLTSYTKDTKTFTLYPATRYGYEFKGWYTDKALTKRLTNVTKGSTGNITVYAKWSKINVAKVANVKLVAGAKQFKVSFDKVSGTSGYEIEYSTQSNMRLPGKKAITGTSVTIKNLKAKTTYYVRVRAYKTVNGQKVYGSWSNVKQVKTK
jgi:uncharacterized repeat protein (TIGR02543 family)